MNLTEIKERCWQRGVQVEHVGELGWYWFIDDQRIAPSRLFDTEQQAWEAAARWLFTEITDEIADVSVE